MRAQWVCSRERRIALYKRSSINQCTQRNWETDRQTDRQTDMQAGRRTDRDRQRDGDRQTEFTVECFVPCRTPCYKDGKTGVYSLLLFIESTYIQSAPAAYAAQTSVQFRHTSFSSVVWRSLTNTAITSASRKPDDKKGEGAGGGERQRTKVKPVFT